SVRQTTFFPEFTQVAERMRQEALSVIERFGGIEHMLEMANALDRLGLAYIVQGLAELGCPTQPGASLTVEALLNEHQVKPHYRLLLRRLFNILETYAYVELQTPEAAIIKQPLSVTGLRSSWADALAQFPGAYAELSLIRNCGSCLAAVLKGEIDPLQLLFPDGSSTLAEHVYTDSPSNLPYLYMVREAVAMIAEALPLGRRLRILEIGAGTGGLTTHVLPLLPKDNVSYVFSDISGAFFIAAEQRFNDCDFIDYRLLNIEKSPLEQDFSADSFDLILASNVLHATADLKTALRNIHQLLTPQGALIVLEAELRSPWVDIVFGLTEGWWRFKDFDLRPDYPLIKRQQWRQVLSDCGFINTVFTGDLAEVHADSPQLIFLAQAAKEEIGERDDRLARPTDDNPASVHWLIFADRQGTAAALQDYLAQHRYAATLLLPGEDSRTIADGVWSIKPGDKAQLDQACRSILTSKRFNIVHLWSLDSEPLDSDGYPAMLKANSVASHTILYLIQCLD
ncbi:MAG: class I SAM-dependent methyltransferase, partial [Methylococcales bacterium]